MLSSLNEILQRNGISSVTPSERVSVFYRLSLNRTLYYSAKYGRVKKRNSFTVKYISNDGNIAYGQIQYYVCNALMLAVIKKVSPCGLLHEIVHITIDTLDKVLLPVSFLGVYDCKVCICPGF